MKLQRIVIIACLWIISAVHAVLIITDPREWQIKKEIREILRAAPETKVLRDMCNNPDVQNLSMSMADHEVDLSGQTSGRQPVISFMVSGNLPGEPPQDFFYAVEAGIDGYVPVLHDAGIPEDNTALREKTYVDVYKITPPKDENPEEPPKFKFTCPNTAPGLPSFYEPAPKIPGVLDGVKDFLSRTPSAKQEQFAELEWRMEQTRQEVAERTRWQHKHRDLYAMQQQLREFKVARSWQEMQKQGVLTDKKFLQDHDLWHEKYFQDIFRQMPGYKSHIYALAARMREDPEYLKRDVFLMGVDRYKWFGGAIQSKNDHSLFQQYVFDEEKSLREKEAPRIKELQDLKEKYEEPYLGPEDPEDREFRLSQMNVAQPTFEDHVNIYQLAQADYAATLDIAPTEGLKPAYDRLVQRANFLESAAAHAHEEYDWKLDVAPALLNEAPEFRDLQEFTGNTIKADLVGDACRQGERAQALGKDDIAQANRPLVYALAVAATKQEDPRIAYHLTDACFHLNRMAELVPEALRKPGAILVKGVGLGVKGAAEHLVDFAKNPVGTVYNDFLATGELAYKALGAAYTVALGNEDERELLLQQAKAIGYHFYENPEEAVAFVTQMLIPGPGAVMSGTLRSMKIVQRLGQAAAQQQKLQNTLARLGTAAEPVRKACLPATRALTDTTQKLGATVLTLRDKVIAQYKKRMPPVDWKHIVLPEVEIVDGVAKKVKGYHHANNKRFPVTRIAQDKNGVFEGVFKVDGIVKKSTFFPESWDNKMMVKKIKEAYQHGLKNKHLQTKGQGLVGMTQEGIQIRFWFQEVKGKPGHFRISSIYPECAIG